MLGVSDLKSAGIPADLLTVIEAWDTLPDAMKAGILAIVKAAKE
jgi:hypothetical protein